VTQRRDPDEALNPRHLEARYRSSWDFEEDRRVPSRRDAARFVGLGLNEAQRAAVSEGLSVRVDDGNPSTFDYQPRRVNLWLSEGRVHRAELF
jgi:hypothetical protein